MGTTLDKPDEHTVDVETEDRVAERAEQAPYLPPPGPSARGRCWLSRVQAASSCKRQTSPVRSIAIMARSRKCAVATRAILRRSGLSRRTRS